MHAVHVSTPLQRHTMATKLFSATTMRAEKRAHRRTNCNVAFLMVFCVTFFLLCDLALRLDALMSNPENKEHFAWVHNRRNLAMNDEIETQQSTQRQERTAAAKAYAEEQVGFLLLLAALALYIVYISKYYKLMHP